MDTETNSDSRLAPSERRIEALERTVADLHVQLASQRPVESIVKYLLYFWTALAVVVALFGLKQFSDLDSVVGEQVRRQLPRDQQRFAEFERLVQDSTKTAADLDKLTSTYRERLRQLQLSGALDRIEKLEPDLSGRVAALISETSERSEKAPNYQSERPFVGTTLDPEWRYRAKATLIEFATQLPSNRYPDDFVFNTLQTASILDLPEASKLLAQHLQSSENLAHRAKALSTQVKSGTQAERVAAFDKLLQLVKQPSSPHDYILLSEAWNGAENLRRYQDLLKVIEQAISADPEKSAYWYLIASRLAMRSGAPNWEMHARDKYEAGVSRLRGESPLSPSYDASLSEAVFLKREFLRVRTSKDKLEVLR